MIQAVRQAESLEHVQGPHRAAQEYGRAAGHAGQDRRRLAAAAGRDQARIGRAAGRVEEAPGNRASRRRPEQAQGSQGQARGVPQAAEEGDRGHREPRQEASGRLHREGQTTPEGAGGDRGRMGKIHGRQAQRPEQASRAGLLQPEPAQGAGRRPDRAQDGQGCPDQERRPTSPCRWSSSGPRWPRR